MSTYKDAKTMAKSLRGALADRNVPLSHSDCLEIVARQFGFADWNTLVAKLPAAEERPTRSQGADSATTMAAEAAEASQTTQTAAPWSKCSFCGKSRPEVRIVIGGCGGWEGFRARRDPESGERSNVFICSECVALVGKINADHSGMLASSVPPAAE
jgi:hypothetical protein